MNIKRIALLAIPWVLVIISSVIIWKQCSTSNKEVQAEEKVVVNHHMVVERMEAIGRIELVKYYIKDIVEHEVIKDWWPDPKIVLIISGEVVGCLDLTKIDSNNIEISKDSIRIKLPQPELCYHKINHKESKVYSVEKEYFAEAELVDNAYRLAEKQIEVAAVKMKILDQTKINAEVLLKPFIQKLTGKIVVFYY